MAISDRKWDGSSANYRDANAFCAACIIDTNDGGDKVVANCKLPVREPNGDLNRNAVHNAAARFNQLDVPADVKKAAARKLIGYYRELKEDAPEVIREAAGIGSRQVSANIRRAAGKGG